MSNPCAIVSLPEYQAVFICGYLFFIQYDSLWISEGSMSPPMKQKHVIAAEYFPINASRNSSVMGSPASSQSHGL